MKSTNFTLVRYDADEGYVFDYKEPRIVEEDGCVIEQHLFVKTLFIGENDSIDNYIEVEEVH